MNSPLAFAFVFPLCLLFPSTSRKQKTKGGRKQSACLIILKRASKRKEKRRKVGLAETESGQCWSRRTRYSLISVMLRRMSIETKTDHAKQTREKKTRRRESCGIPGRVRYDDGDMSTRVTHSHDGRTFLNATCYLFRHLFRHERECVRFQLYS